MDYEFVECEACKAKSETPLLCPSCIANRTAISELTARVDELEVADKPWRTGQITGADCTRQEGDGKRHGEMSINITTPECVVTVPSGIEWRAARRHVAAATD